ncbi:hypothetical protein B9Z19DRAFT_1065481 [Tuber borchii]|uniref:Uncharacterized protein n=1 Tax=Tuber borchii TaxID=42251 RepID=A0A2T6ZQZ3_TUBBO|nr:hypothetical protein B9Z19DRAFT_1065481 [Tuber borchii]
MPSMSGGQGCDPHPIYPSIPRRFPASLPQPSGIKPAESASNGDAITHSELVISSTIYDEEIPLHDVSNGHPPSSNHQPLSPEQTPLQKLQLQLNKARFEREIATIQARAQNSPLAKLPKPILPAQTTASTTTTSISGSRGRSGKKGREFALPPADSYVPREDVENVMESLGIICYCVVDVRVLGGTPIAESRFDHGGLCDSVGGCGNHEGGLLLVGWLDRNPARRGAVGTEKGLTTKDSA